MKKIIIDVEVGDTFCKDHSLFQIRKQPDGSSVERELSWMCYSGWGPMSRVARTPVDRSIAIGALNLMGYAVRLVPGPMTDEQCFEEAQKWSCIRDGRLIQLLRDGGRHVWVARLRIAAECESVAEGEGPSIVPAIVAAWRAKLAKEAER